MELLKSRHFDAIWIEKEALPWMPLWLEQLLLARTPYAMDFDDAIFHNYDSHRKPMVRWLYHNRIDSLMKKASLVVVGNGYLAARASSAGARHVEIVPTVIDLDRYPDPSRESAVQPGTTPPIIVWIGTPHTVKYLKVVGPALHALAQRVPFRLRIIGGGHCPITGIDSEIVPWDEATEVGILSSSDIGIMPLLSTPWELGKCGYKLIQYMACGLPTVASAVGANTTVVDDGVTGYLATGSEQWTSRLEELLLDGDLRRRMGCAGRKRVEQFYALQVTGPRYAKLLLGLMSA